MTPLRRLVLLYNAVLAPIAATGLLLVARSGGSKTLLWAGVAITAVSPFAAYLVTLAMLRRRHG